MRAVLLSAFVLLTSCTSYRQPEQRFEKPTSAFVDTWQARADSTETMGYLAAVEFESHQRKESFTLEMFYRRPDTYVLRGRGTLGATGFRAKLVGDSLTFLLNRENRGYSGPVDNYPDSSLIEMWRLMADALPWLFGTHPIHEDNLDALSTWRVQLTNRGTRPVYIEVLKPPRRLALAYGRYRSEYPYWHLKTAAGSNRDGKVALEFRQWLHNTDLPGATFELTLPPNTPPLND